MCYRIAETMESPQEVESTDGNHENYHFQANLSQNPGWTPRSNHGRLQTTGGWKPQKGKQHDRVDTMESPREVETTDGNHKNCHFQANLSQNPGWTPQSNHKRVETVKVW